MRIHGFNAWPEVRLGDVATQGSGHTPSKQRPEYWDGPIQWVSLADTGKLDRGYISTTEKTVTAEGIAHSAAVVRPPETVILLRGSSVGKSAILGCEMAVSQDYVTWTCGPNLDSWYLYYVLQSRKQEFSRIGFGNTIKTIGLDYFQHMTVPLPPLGEQQAVSGCLRDADRLVELLSQLIAKKRALKQGMMQELFTGRTRLPGFTSEWKPLTLGSAGSTYSGLVGKSGKDFGHGRGRFITFVEVMRDARLHGVELAQVDVKHGERQNNVRRGDVLFNGSSETPEEVALAAAVQFDKTDIFLNSFCFGYRLSRLGVVDPLFLAYFFRATPGRNLIISLAQGSTRYNIAKTKLMKTAVKLPEFAEQQAIASLIRDADAEIEALERRLEATRAIKQGMMQELLTGRTRLVAEGTA